MGEYGTSRKQARTIRGIHPKRVHKAPFSKCLSGHSVPPPHCAGTTPLSAGCLERPLRSTCVSVALHRVHGTATLTVCSWVMDMDVYPHNLNRSTQGPGLTAHAPREAGLTPPPAAPLTPPPSPHRVRQCMTHGFYDILHCVLVHRWC